MCLTIVTYQDWENSVSLSTGWNNPLFGTSCLLMQSALKEDEIYFPLLLWITVCLKLDRPVFVHLFGTVECKQMSTKKSQVFHYFSKATPCPIPHILLQNWTDGQAYFTVQNVLLFIQICLYYFTALISKACIIYTWNGYIPLLEKFCSPKNIQWKLIICNYI